MAMKDLIRGKGTIITSSVIIAAIMGMAWFDKLPGISPANQRMPFLFSLLGVALYVMASVRTKRERFRTDIYLPDYFFRAAQTVVYLYVVLAIFFIEGQKAAAGQKPSTTYDLTSWPPVLVGLLVGLFILHVEKAMEALGQRFQEVLTSILGRSLTAKTEREKQIEKISYDQKFREIRSQAEGMASQIRDPALAQALQARLDSVESTFRDGDLSGIADEVTRLSWEFEDVKRSTREEELTVEELIAALRRDRRGDG